MSQGTGVVDWRFVRRSVRDILGYIDAVNTFEFNLGHHLNDAPTWNTSKLLSRIL
jgi:hypothetical protein